MTEKNHIQQYIESVKSDVKLFVSAIETKDGKTALQAYSNMVAACATAETVIKYTENEELKTLNEKLLASIRNRYMPMMLALLK